MIKPYIFYLKAPYMQVMVPEGEEHEHIVDSMQCSCQPSLKFCDPVWTIVHSPMGEYEAGDYLRMIVATISEHEETISDVMIAPTIAEQN